MEGQKGRLLTLEEVKTMTEGKMIFVETTFPREKEFIGIKRGHLIIDIADEETQWAVAIDFEVLCKAYEYKVELSDIEKLEIINSMEIIESSASCGEIEYILVEDNSANREILYKLDLSDEDIENECYPESECLDISSVAFKYANWYDGRTRKFLTDKPMEGNHEI